MTPFIRPNLEFFRREAILEGRTGRNRLLHVSYLSPRRCDHVSSRVSAHAKRFGHRRFSGRSPHFRTGSCATASNPMIMFASVLLDVFSTGQRRRFISATNFRGSRDYANQLKKFTLRASNRSERKFQLRIDEVLILVYVFVSARSCRNTVRCLNDDTNRGGKT
jgi:hypothetical protein